ncbi:MAG TPA: hypothetical protein VHA79_07735 [Mycobacteriales bacterium]|nr:hypothetical protein [Mycobacteriales bacterium]
MGTIFYPPGWEGPMDPAGQVVDGPGQPNSALPPHPGPAVTSVTPAEPAAPRPAPYVSPPPAPTSGSRRRPSMPRIPAMRWPAGKVLPVLAALLVVVLVAVAVDQNSTAKKWRKNERIEATRAQDLTSRLTRANASISSMSTQVVSLQGHVAHLKKALQSAANQKEKALDQNVVLTQITGAAGVISDELSSCVDRMQSLITEIEDDLSLRTYDPYLGSNAAAAGSACSSAQRANSALQTAISNLR